MICDGCTAKFHHCLGRVSTCRCSCNKALALSSELTGNIWSVISPDTVVGMYLTYDQADTLIRETLQYKLHEAAIVTNNVARRMLNGVGV